MMGQLNTYHLYYANIDNNVLIIIPPTCVMTAATSLLPTNLAIWHHRFAYLNGTYLKRLLNKSLGIKIFARPDNLSSYIIYIHVKMTRQPHQDQHILSRIAVFYIDLDIKESANVYITWKGYRYFALFVDDTTRITWVYFMKKKSDILSVFKYFIVLLEKYYNIQVCILHTDFSEFNSDMAAKYLSHTGIIWELSMPNA